MFQIGSSFFLCNPNLDIHPHHVCWTNAWLEINVKVSPPILFILAWPRSFALCDITPGYQKFLHPLGRRKWCNYWRIPLSKQPALRHMLTNQQLPFVGVVNSFLLPNQFRNAWSPGVIWTFHSNPELFTHKHNRDTPIPIIYLHNTPDFLVNPVRKKEALCVRQNGPNLLYNVSKL